MGETMKTYTEYYIECREKYKQEEGESEPLVENLVYDLTAAVHRPDDASTQTFFTFPDNYGSLIDSLSEKISAKMEDPNCHWKDPSQNGYGMAIQVRDIWDLPEIEEIAQSLIPQVEKSIFNSYVFVSAVHTYRNITTDEPLRSSWLWHYDNNPHEAVKILIYLTDVTENTGPFEYLRHQATGDGIKVPTSRTGHNHWLPPYIAESRMRPEDMVALENQGFEQTKVTGPKGTAIFFDNNIVHKANVPIEAHRDIIILNIRPIDTKIRPLITQSTCGSWGNKSPLMNPAQIKPLSG